MPVKKRVGRPKKRRSTSRVRGSASVGSITVDGKRFTKKACGTKTEMKKKAVSVRASGGKARVKKTGKGYCLYTRAR